MSVMSMPRFLPRIRKPDGDKWVGMLVSVLFHGGLLFVGSLALVKPVEFAVDLGQSSMEVDLVAAPPEPEEVVEEPPPPVKEEVAEVKEEILPPKLEPPKPIEKKPEPPKPVEKPTQNTITVKSTGGAIIEAKPDYLSNPAPKYPFSAKQNGWEGVVLLKVLVGKKGQALSVEVHKSSGYDVLDQAALKTVKTWQFSPSKLGDIPVESSVIVPVRFKLE